MTPTHYPALSWLNLVWAAWLAWFLGWEFWALFSGLSRYTLSDTVWAIEHLDRAQPFDFQMWTDVHWAIAGSIWLLFLWLSIHLPFGLLDI